MQRSDSDTDPTQTANRLALIFARRRGDAAMGALHDVLAERGVRRLTVATLAHDPANPVRYHYHADRGASAAGLLDQSTLAAALGAEQPRILPAINPVSVLPNGRESDATYGRLAHAMTCPIRAAGKQLGFCVAQGEKQFDDADLAVLDLASVFIGQQIELEREELIGAAKSRAVELLLHTARALSTELDLDQLFAKFQQLVGRVMDASIFFAALLTPDGLGLEMQYLSEFGKGSFDKVILPLSTVSGKVVASGYPMIMRSTEDWDRVVTQTMPDTSEPTSGLIVPIKLGAHVLGVLSVQSTRPAAYGEDDCDLLVAISEQAALAVENLRNLRASTERAAELSLLVEVANAVSSELDLRRVFSKIHSQVRRVLDAPLFYVALASDEDDSVRLEYLVEGDRVFQATSYATGGTIVGLVIQSGQPVLVRNAEERDRLTNQRIGSGPTTVQSVAAVPMHVAGRVIGAISIQSYEPEAYNERHMHLLTAIAEQSAVAVQNAKLYEQARVLADNDALTGLPHHRTIQERMSSELKRAQRHNGKLAVCMIDIDSFKAFNDSYGHPAGDRAIKHVARALRQVSRETDIVGRYGGDEFCAVLPDADRKAAERFAERLSAEMGRRPVMLGARQAVPLTLSIGIAVFPDDRQRKDELIAAADAELYVKKRGDQPKLGPKQESRQLLMGHLDPFASFVSALTNHSRFSREHLYNMNALAGVYAEFASLGDAAGERETLLRAATLVDIGMLAVPGGILSKPGKLDHAEYDIVKTHARLGYEMLRLMEGCERMADAILHHHERFDGSGYPDGLVGDQIPMLSRVLAVLDSYSAMTSDRPFRRAMSRDDAVKELRAHRGSQFDPAVVEMFLKALGA